MTIRRIRVLSRPLFSPLPTLLYSGNKRSYRGSPASTYVNVQPTRVNADAWQTRQEWSACTNIYGLFQLVTGPCINGERADRFILGNLCKEIFEILYLEILGNLFLEIFGICFRQFLEIYFWQFSKICFFNF